MKKIPLLLCILLHSLFSFSQTQTDIDRNALVALYNATNGPSWTNNTNWSSDKPINEWFGVIIENERVTQIDLFNNNLVGSLPQEIGLFTNLRFLNLSYNKLIGSIPVEFTQLINLQSFYLSNNQLAGALPDQLDQLTQLNSFDIGENNFTGTLPASICTIPSLYGVNFSGNNFDDQSCPTIKCLMAKNLNFWGQAGQRQKSGFMLTQDCVPPITSKQDSLALVALYNSTDGPNWSSKMNWLTSRVYKWHGVTVENGRVTQIELSNNNLDGNLPIEIGQFTNLRYLNLQSNKLIGSIPVEFTQLINLQSFYLSNNQLAGALPDQLDQLTQLNSFDIGENNFTGTLPTSICTIPSLYGVNFSGNNFDDQSCPTIKCLMAKNLNFWGQAGQRQKSGFMLTQDCVPPITLKQDSLALVALYNSTDGPNWTNRTNWLTSRVYKWHGVTVENSVVTQIDLVDNNLTGNLPQEIGQLANLRYMYLYYNKLSGSLPVEFTQLINLQSFYLSNNQLVGTIPDQLGQLTQLNSFDIGENNFTGTLPASICAIPSLNGVNFSGNNFDDQSCPMIKCLMAKNVNFWGQAGQRQDSGFMLTQDCVPPITSEQDSLALVAFYNSTDGPNWTNNSNWLTSLVYKWHGVTVENGRVTQISLDNNNLSGNLPPDIGQLTSLRNLSFQMNKLSGSIPLEFAQLNNLQSISFYYNQLEGTIPDQLGQLTQLNSFDISQNNFTGSIPLSICTIPNLNGVNFSYNNFDGISCPTIKCLIAKNVNFWGIGQPQKSGNMLTFDCNPPKIAEQDSLALVAFYNSTDGPNWANKANWLTTPIYKWFGVYVENGRVVEIGLGANNLTGRLTSEIGQLTNLRALGLNQNKLNGNIPVEIGHLFNLIYLNLDDNQFNGPLPTELNQLSNLRILELRNNQLSGDMSSSIAGLENLNVLMLSKNSFSGVIPGELCNFPDLQRVNFSENNLDSQNCPVIQCLKDRGVIFEDYMQFQKTGFSLTEDCNANPNINRSLIITESRMNFGPNNYLEITNMGTTAIQLNQFELGFLTPWSPARWQPYGNMSIFLPDKILQPGKSFVIAARNEYGPKQFNLGKEGFIELETQEDVIAIADLILDRPETKGGQGTEDLISPNWETLDDWNGRGCWFLRQHLNENESVVIDQVGGVFDGFNGLNVDRTPNSYDVAGVPNATGSCVLIRKNSIKTGNRDFANGRGTNPDNSEWIPVPLSHGSSPWRSSGWTLGNHGNYSLDENTLTSNRTDLSIDFANKTITIPYGIRTLDDIMNYIDKKPGIAWSYIFGRDNLEDCLFQSVRSGDKLKIWVCGNDANVATFDLIAIEPDPSANSVIPIGHKDALGNWKNGLQFGIIDWPRVIKDESGSEVITGIKGGLPFATRKDSLLKYLEKPINANLEFVLLRGEQRADLISGDKLKVTATNGTVKEYEIQLQPYLLSHIADLEAISWRDIPQEMLNTNGWRGDVIPGFASAIYKYTVNIPHFITDVPVLVAIPKDKKAKVKLEMSYQPNENPENKLIIINVTAEDGYTKRTYTVYFNKERTTENTQSNFAEPFLSEFIFRDQWANGFGEICNPGNQKLDLSDYMIAMEWNPDPNDVIKSGMSTGDWLDRFDKYVPGYKWVNQAQWSVTPGILVKDPNVNAVIEPGDVFCFGNIAGDGRTNELDYSWPIPTQLDVQFNNYTSLFTGKLYPNPWGEEESIALDANPISKWRNSNWYLFKIKNEAVKNGLKPANDPNDFELIERFGMNDGSDWIIGGKLAEQVTNYIRKPEITKGNPVAKGSFGNNPEDCEWTWMNADDWKNLDYPYPFNELNIGYDLGKHVFNKITTFQSTVFSSTYHVTKGYSMTEAISAILTGTDSETFLSNIIKGDANQTLTVSSATNANILNATDILSIGDILTVVSADGKNTTKYILGVSDIGLSSDTEIIPIDNSAVVVMANIISGFEYGTTLKTLMDNIVIPQGASVSIVDANNNPLPYTITDYSVQNVPVYVNADMSIIVTSEDGKSEMVYNVEPEFVSGQIFIGSDYFEVNQSDQVIGTVQPGTTVEQLLSSIYTIPGATIMIVDKDGFERVTGSLYMDDKLVVSFNTNAYLRLKAASEPLVKEYKIFISKTPASARVKDFILELNESGVTQLMIDDINNNSVGGGIESWLTISKTDFDCNSLGENYVTLAVNNYLGKVSVAEAKVTVVDNIDPVIHVHDLIDVNEDGLYQPILDINSSIKVTDNCGISSITNDAPVVFPVGTTIVNWKITDTSERIFTATQEVTITNRPPVITAIDAPITPVIIQNSINLIAHYIDNNLKSAIWSWGDGTTSLGIIGENIVGTHKYMMPGVYVVEVTATDAYDLSATFEYRYVVIYDPEGGFVTGGGWINSPIGASVDYPEAIGIANFGFVSKYVKGQTKPVGNTEFKFKAGALDFKSTEYEWLVVAGAKAKFKGIGKIGGTGNYGFMISAIDGDLKKIGDPDLFRIKIWNIINNHTVYDNQMGVSFDYDPVTRISGGSIVIHNPNTKSAFITAQDDLNDLNLNQFKVYPNPTSGKFKIEGFNPNETYMIRLIDISGKGILSQKVNSSEIEIDLTNYPSGVYNLNIGNSNTNANFHIIKK